MAIVESKIIVVVPFNAGRDTINNFLYGEGKKV